MSRMTSVTLSAEDRSRLEAVVRNRNALQKHVWRARLVLSAAAGLSASQVAARANVSRPTVWRWTARFAEAGVDGLLRDKTRPPGKPPLPDEAMAKVLARTATEPPGEATHWTGRAIAAAVGISLRSVQRIWAAHKLQPHRMRTFKLSRDPEFANKLSDIVGLSIAPPAHALVLSIDEIENSTLHTERLEREEPVGADQLVLRIYRAMPHTRITDLLLEVDAVTGFTDAFTDLRTGSPCRDRIGLLNVILAYGGCVE